MTTQTFTLKSLLATGLLAIGLSTAFAAPPAGEGQGQERGQMDPGVIAQRMQEHLDLTDDQVQQITQILEAQRQRVTEVMEALKGIHDDTKMQIEQVLSPEQLQMFESMKESRKAKRQGDN